ncbi:MAG: hypothetical protein AB1705_17175 [Verrucomicrobiota bacterium]
MNRSQFILALCAAVVLVDFSLCAQDGESFKVSQFTFKQPKGWEKQQSGGMRAAQFKVTDAKIKGEAEVVFFYFGPGGAGGVQANVDRWFSQFQEPKDKINAKTEEVTVGGTKVTYVSAEGTYMSGSPFGPKTPMPNHALVGGIIEGSEGSVFVRLTGPKDLAKAATADFKKMIEGALKK